MPPETPGHEVFDKQFEGDLHRNTPFTLQGEDQQTIFSSKQYRDSLTTEENGVDLISADREKFEETCKQELQTFCSEFPEGTLAWVSKFISQKTFNPLFYMHTMALKEQFDGKEYIMSSPDRNIEVKVSIFKDKNRSDKKYIKIDGYLWLDKYQLAAPDGQFYDIDQTTGVSTTILIDPDNLGQPILGDTKHLWGQVRGVTVE